MKKYLYTCNSSKCCVGRSSVKLSLTAINITEKDEKFYRIVTPEGKKKTTRRFQPNFNVILLHYKLQLTLDNCYINPLNEPYTEAGFAGKKTTS